MRLALKSGNKVHILGENQQGDWAAICGRPDDGEWAWDIDDSTLREHLPEPLCRKCERIAFREVDGG